jgi:hypothetical protein
MAGAPSLATITRLRPSVSMPPVPSVPRPDRMLGGLPGALSRRWHGTFEMDEWGFDRELFHYASNAIGAIWQVSVGGAEHVPAHGGALLAVNTRPYTAGPALVAHAVHRRTERAVRFTGLPDVAPVGPLLRKLGGVLARPDEIAGLLRNGHLVAVWLTPVSARPERAGEAPPELLAPALAEHCPVLPVAAIGHPLGRRWRVEVGPPVRHRRHPGPLAEVELADETRAAVQRILDESAPPRWLLPG